MANYREQKTPRISANELAKFLVATDLGREGIIRHARWQGTVMVSRYRVARNAIGGFLATRAPKVIMDARARLDAISGNPESSAFRREDANASIVALDNFLRRWNQFAIGGLNFQKAPKLTPLTIEGVAVAVTLDAVARAPNPDRIGGVLLRMSRGDAETENASTKRREIGRNAAVLVFMCAQTSLANGSAAATDLCYSLDVQHGEAIQTPRNYLPIVQNLHAACRAIAAGWDTATPPGGDVS
jgi:hypothetical protein